MTRSMWSSKVSVTVCSKPLAQNGTPSLQNLADVRSASRIYGARSKSKAGIRTLPPDFTTVAIAVQLRLERPQCNHQQQWHGRALLQLAGAISVGASLEQERRHLLARIAEQLTPDSLLPIEQFDVGGVDTVRGYRQNQLVTDNGVLSTLELHVPVARNPGVLELRPFFDIGTV